MLKKLNDMMDDLGLSSNPEIFDNEGYLKERKELDDIANSLPDDGVLDKNDLLRLSRLCIRGMNICDSWLPKLHVLMTLCEVEKDKARAMAYVNAKGKENEKLTAELRKAISEINEEYNNKKIIAEKIKGAKLFHEKKRDTLKTSYFFFRDQLCSYKTSDKGNTGDDIEGTEGGKVSW